MIARGGHIINVSSRASRAAYPDPYALYAASKAGLDAVTRTLATSWAEPKGITVNTIMPGPVATGELFVAVLRYVAATNDRL